MVTLQYQILVRIAIAYFIIEKKKAAPQPWQVIAQRFCSMRIFFEWKKGDKPYYSVNNDKNNALYEQYRELADKEDKVIFGGRLGGYKYYDMDKVVKAALEMCESELGVEAIVIVDGHIYIKICKRRGKHNETCICNWFKGDTCTIWWV